MLLASSRQRGDETIDPQRRNPLRHLSLYCATPPNTVVDNREMGLKDACHWWIPRIRQSTQQRPVWISARHAGPRPTRKATHNVPTHARAKRACMANTYEGRLGRDVKRSARRRIQHTAKYHSVHNAIVAKLQSASGITSHISVPKACSAHGAKAHLLHALPHSVALNSE